MKMHKQTWKKWLRNQRSRREKHRPKKELMRLQFVISIHAFLFTVLLCNSDMCWSDGLLGSSCTSLGKVFGAIVTGSSINLKRVYYRANIWEFWPKNLLALSPPLFLTLRTSGLKCELKHFWLSFYIRDICARGKLFLPVLLKSCKYKWSTHSV